MNGRGWTVWCPDGGGTVEDGKRIHPSGAGAHCVRDAACLYAKRHAGFEGDPFDTLDVHVRDEDTGQVFAVTIHVEMVASFTTTPERLLP